MRQMNKTRVKFIIFQRNYKCHMHHKTHVDMANSFFLGVKLGIRKLIDKQIRARRVN